MKKLRKGKNFKLKKASIKFFKPFGPNTRRDIILDNYAREDRDIVSSAL